MKHINQTFIGLIVMAILYGNCFAADPMEERGAQLASALDISTNGQTHITNTPIFSDKQSVMAGEFKFKQKRILKSSQPGSHIVVDILNTNDLVIATGRIIECESSNLARKLLLEQLAMNAMTIEALARQYKVLQDDVGELCIGETIYDETSKAFVLDPSVIHFVRGGAAITIHTKDKSKAALDLARTIDKGLAATTAGSQKR